MKGEGICWVPFFLSFFPFFVSGVICSLETGEYMGILFKYPKGVPVK